MQLVLENKATQIDDLLDKMAEEVQLDQTRYNRMVKSYQAVRDWIEADEKFFKPYRYEVYPQGSVRIFTTVKPIGKDEFDLDIVIHFKDNTFYHSPERLYLELERRLNEHETYKRLLQPKSRVLRLNYAGDFHMDVMPGIQQLPLDQNRIKVPDRKLEGWVSSNPRGYADWFLHQANRVEVSLLERNFSAEEIQADNFKNKKPLQRAVQLIKRYRDIYFEGKEDFKTSSIVLTTLAGQLYQGEESIFNTVESIIRNINTSFPTYGRLKVLNPVNPDEDFTDKWDKEPRYYQAFQNFMDHLHNQWQRLKEENGMREEALIYKRLFGESVFKNAQLKQAGIIAERRKSGKLGIMQKSGILTGAKGKESQPIKKNTFFGE